MQSYVYKGKSKVYSQPVEKKSTTKPLFKNMGFILCATYPSAGFKINGSKLLANHNGSEILEYQLDLIKETCENPEIIVTTGVDSRTFMKHTRKSEFIIIENQLSEFSNTAEDLRLGLLALRAPHVIFIDSGFIPTTQTLKYLLGHKDRSSKAFIKEGRDPEFVGIKMGQNGYIESYNFLTENNLVGMYYINPNDIDRIKKKSFGKKFSKNQYTFEVLKELKVKAILDESKSILVTR